MTSTRWARLLMVLFATLFFMVLAAVSFLPDQLFKWQFQQQVDYIVEHQRSREGEIQEVMSGLLSALTFTCSENDRRLLQLPRFKSRYILLTGLMTADNKTCSSLGQRFKFPVHDLIGRSTGVQNTFFFRIGDFQDSLQKLVITYRHEQAVLFVVLSSESFYRLLDRTCEDCFYIEFSFANQAALEIGDHNIKHERHAYHHTFKAANRDLDITIYAGDKLLQVAYQDLYKMIGLAILVMLMLAGGGAVLIHLRRGTLQGKIKSAIKNREFIPYYQPVFDLENNCIVGAEVLIRWKNNGEWIAPDQFISCAEESNLIMPVTQVLFDKVMADIRRLPKDIWLSINISAKHFEAGHLLDLLSDIPPELANRISLEITERHPIKDVGDAAIKISALHNRGVDFKLDDFGTGYGGVAYLQLLGVRSIKIDKMFIDTIGTDDFKAGVLESIIAFGIESGYEMIAEGVETEEQATYLVGKGVILHQGYFYGKPMPLSEFIKPCY